MVCAQQIRLDLGADYDRAGSFGDDWETPDPIAWLLARTAIDLADGTICEPCAGTGAIALHLPPGSIANEPAPARYHRGSARVTHWHCQLAWELNPSVIGPIGGIVTNPPWSIADQLLPFFADMTSGPIVLLLPTDYWQTQRRNQVLIDSGLAISQEVRLVVRVAYLHDGVARDDRRACDSIFVLSQTSSKTSFYWV